MSRAVASAAHLHGKGYGIGNRGPWRTPITRTLVSQLNEVWDKTDPDSMTKMDKVCERLIATAIGEDRQVPLCKIKKDKNGNEQLVAIADERGAPVMVTIPGVPDVSAIREITDRVQGRAAQQINVSGDDGKSLNVTMIFGNMEPGDVMASFEDARKNASNPNLKLAPPVIDGTLSDEDPEAA